MVGFSYFRHAVVPNLICFIDRLDREPTKQKPTCDTVTSNVEDLIENITTKKTVCKRNPDIFRFNIPTVNKSQKKNPTKTQPDF